MGKIGWRRRISEGLFWRNFTPQKVRLDDVKRKPRINRKLYRARPYGNRSWVDGGPKKWWFLLHGFVLLLMSSSAFLLCNALSSSCLCFLVVMSTDIEPWALVFIYVNKQSSAKGRNSSDRGSDLVPSEVATSL